MGPTWVLSAPGVPHVGPMNLAVRVTIKLTLSLFSEYPRDRWINILTLSTVILYYHVHITIFSLHLIPSIIVTSTLSHQEQHLWEWSTHLSFTLIDSLFHDANMGHFIYSPEVSASPFLLVIEIYATDKRGIQWFIFNRGSAWHHMRHLKSLITWLFVQQLIQ